MKTSLHWLQDYLPGPPLSADAAAEALTHGGLPVETIERHGDDAVLDVEVTSNRGDCLSPIGVARELSALLNREFRESAAGALTGGTQSATPASSATAVAIEAPQLCPHYIARVIRNVKVKPSPQWLSSRLEAVGVRSINNIVD